MERHANAKESAETSTSSYTLQWNATSATYSYIQPLLSLHSPTSLGAGHRHPYQE